MVSKANAVNANGQAVDGFGLMKFGDFYSGSSWKRENVIAAQRERAEINASEMGWQVRPIDLLSGPLDPRLVSEFEAAFGVRLPEDYRSFLLQVGDGGVGPGLFMRPLGAPFNDSEDWEPGAISRDGSFNSLHLPFPYSSGIQGDVDLEQVDRSVGGNSEWDPPGALHLWDFGCAIWGLLVVTGPAAGQIWIDSRTDGSGLNPQIGKSGKAIGFAEYYCRWLATGR